MRMRKVPLLDSSVGLGDIVGVVVGTLVVVGASVLICNKLAEGNSDGTSPGPLVYSVGRYVGTPPNPLVGRLLLVAMGNSVGSRDVGTPPNPLVGRLLLVAMGDSVGSRDVCTPCVEVGTEEDGDMLTDGLREVDEDAASEGVDVIDGVPVGLAVDADGLVLSDGLSDGIELDDGAMERIDPLRRTLGEACSVASPLIFTSRSKPPEPAEMPIAVRAATTVLPPTTTAAVLRRRRASGVDAIMLLRMTSADESEDYAPVSFTTSCELGTRGDTSTREKRAPRTQDYNSEEDLSLSAQVVVVAPGVVLLLGSSVPRLAKKGD
jgi:hypothetical protein